MDALQKSVEELVKNFGAMAAEVKVVSGDVQGLRQQIVDFGEDLDGVKRRLAEPAKQVRVEIPQATKGAPTARLTNHGPPLIDTSPSGAAGFVTAPSSPAGRAAEETPPAEGTHAADYMVRPRRHDFPRFAGESPLLWIDLCVTYFEMYKVPEHHWVSSAILHLDGHAALWFQSYKRQHRLVHWDSFMQAIVAEFGSDEYDGQMTTLLQLKQTGTVSEYRKSFEECMYHLIALDAALSPRWFVSQFVFGLRDDIRCAVRLQGPTSITRAASLARIQEEENEHHRPRNRVGAPTKHPPSVVAANPAVTTQLGSRFDWPRKQGNDDFNRERQLRDFRRANNQCFKCGDKFSKDHQCKRPGQLLLIEVGDFGEVLSDDAVKALELLEETEAPAACCKLSIDALAGTAGEETIRLRALVGNQVMLLLIDSGSTHTFVTKNFAERAGCIISPAPTMSVKVANGETMISAEQVKGLNWWTQGHTFATDMRLLDIGAYDAILGVNWLKQFGKTTIDWIDKTVSFNYMGKDITLQGIRATPTTELSELSVEQLQKWIQGNEVWALAVIDSVPDVPQDATAQLAPDLQALLDEYTDVFSDPKTLPPQRTLDHAISLEESAAPVNSRPYRYSPLQKDEIERQVQEMLAAGLIIPSMSPFASPVLLVKKKDGSWRFCVDYRRLNTMTIKNKFPLPVVDELLDELSGTQFFSKLDLRAGYHQIRMKPEDECKTAFKTHHGHFQFRVMPFGLTNAPATFQCIMNAVFAPFLRKFVIVFLDDILIYSPTWQLHMQHLRMVLDKLRETQFYAKQSKCSFGQQSIQYLGHIISSAGVATDPEKTSAMENWPLPSNITELRGFLGLTGYYRKFVQHYGIITKPLTQLLTKKGFVWTDEATEAFNKLKTAMVSTPVLALPNFTLPFTVETDACDNGVGAVLMQQNHPIAYMSKALGQMNQKLSIYEKEFLAVIMAVDKWRQYLQRGPFLILTDHKSLTNLNDQVLTSELQKKAMAKLVGLQFEIKYRRGSENGAADSLSRVGHLLEIQTVSTSRPEWLQEVINSYTNDAHTVTLLQELAIKSPNDQGYILEQGLIKFKGRLYIGENLALQTKLIASLHDSAVGGHSGIQASYQRIKQLYYWPGMKMAVENYVKQCAVCQMAKSSRQKPAGLLQPLPPPLTPWSEITMDFIEGLPVSEGFNSILVVVDRLTKYAHFLPLRHPFTAASVAKAYVDNIVKLHGVPLTITSDRDKIFTSHFWKDLIKALGTKLSYSTAYHPQTDGQSERVNQCLEQYLRCAVQDNPRHWKKWLSLAEFWYNSSFHSALGGSPFKALYKTEPNFGGMPNLTVADESVSTEATLEYQAQTELLRAQLVRAQLRMKHYADRNRTERQFQVGEQVLLKLQPYAQQSVVNRPYPKLSYKYFGPYTVTERIGEVAYRLALPEAAQVHPVFHVSQLKPFTSSYTPVYSELPTAPALHTKTPTPVEILDRRLVRKGNSAMPQVLIRWAHMPDNCTTWEDYYVLKTRYPEASVWDTESAPVAPSSGGDTVTPSTSTVDTTKSPG